MTGSGLDTSGASRGARALPGMPVGRCPPGLWHIDPTGPVVHGLPPRPGADGEEAVRREVACLLHHLYSVILVLSRTCTHMSGDTEWLYVTEDCLVLALREFVIDNLCN